MAEVIDGNGEVHQVPDPPAALVAVPPPTRALITLEAIEEEREQRAILARYVKEQMVPDVDFGVIPGTHKPTLLKPGGEKLTELFRCTAEFELTHKVEDWDKPLFHYAFTCRIRHRATGMVVAEGVGACNSMEDRYRWRNVQRTCPHCGKQQIIKGKEEYGGGWLCWKKPEKGKDGCGAKFRDGDPVIESQTVGKVPNEDIYTQVNTILKMAKKRAHVDAAIALGRVSDIFTQDMEDNGGSDEAKVTTPAKSAKQEPPPGSVTKFQATTLNALIESLRQAVPNIRELCLEKWGVPAVEYLPADQYERAAAGLRAKLEEKAKGKQPVRS